ncbi:hypothetical protein [Paenibacillus sinopodophylli]|uniref:hypothetical protein n=1 Tax=Paenibacillus sinopodophylli TaxID=1837342 RepID=UPI00110CFE1F|nr:hypothetical protein [Paenibacillus sinopodophylli]
MKKVVIAFLAGALLMASGQALADGISKIGKKIDGEAKVVLNGKQLSNAVISEGKSYAPVRDIAEALGASTSYTKGVINIENGLSNDALVEKLRSLKSEKAFIDKKIVDTQTSIDYLLSEDSMLSRLEKLLETPSTNEVIQTERVAQLTIYKQSLADKQKELADLKAQVAIIDAELATLQ